MPRLETICKASVRSIQQYLSNDSCAVARSKDPLFGVVATLITIKPQIMLTSLPVELRVAILKMSIGEHVFHVSTPKDIAPSCPKAAITHAECYCCNNRGQRYLPAVTTTCRLLFNEANEILYRQTTMIFASTEAIDTFFKDKIPALQHIRCLSLSCGPAKHLSPASKSDKRRAIRLLEKYASNLDQVRLCFNSYHGIHYDQHLLSKFWLHNISRLRGLKHFSMDINLDPLGPIGIADVPNVTRARTQLKIEQIESAFRDRVCEPRMQKKHGCSKAKRHQAESLHPASDFGHVTFASKPSQSKEWLQRCENDIVHDLKQFRQY